MSGLGKVAAPPKFLCCAREWFLHLHSLREQRAASSAEQTTEQIAANGRIPPLM
jgi:hypothetical protein